MPTAPPAMARRRLATATASVTPAQHVITLPRLAASAAIVRARGGATPGGVQHASPADVPRIISPSTTAAAMPNTTIVRTSSAARVSSRASVRSTNRVSTSAAGSVAIAIVSPTTAAMTIGWKYPSPTMPVKDMKASADGPATLRTKSGISVESSPNALWRTR